MRMTKLTIYKGDNDKQKRNLKKQDFQLCLKRQEKRYLEVNRETLPKIRHKIRYLLKRR